jgi:hypothetical protein
MPQAAHLSALPPNMLMIVDRAANARRIVDMADRIDKAAPPGERCGAVSSYPPAPPKAEAK